MQDPIMHCKIKTTDSGGLWRDSVLNWRVYRRKENAGGRRWSFPARFCDECVCVCERVCNWVFSVAKEVFCANDCGFYSTCFNMKWLSCPLLPWLFVWSISQYCMGYACWCRFESSECGFFNISCSKWTVSSL